MRNILFKKSMEHFILCKIYRNLFIKIKKKQNKNRNNNKRKNGHQPPRRLRAPASGRGCDRRAGRRGVLSIGHRIGGCGPRFGVHPRARGSFLEAAGFRQKWRGPGAPKRTAGKAPSVDRVVGHDTCHCQNHLLPVQKKIIIRAPLMMFLIASLLWQDPPQLQATLQIGYSTIYQYHLFDPTVFLWQRGKWYRF